MKYYTIKMKDGSIYYNILNVLFISDKIVELQIGYTRITIYTRVFSQSVLSKEIQKKYIKNPK